MVKQKKSRNKETVYYKFYDGVRFYGAIHIYQEGKMVCSDGHYNSPFSDFKVTQSVIDEWEMYTFHPVNLTAYPSLAFKGSKIIDGRLDYFIQDGKSHGWLCDTEPKLIYRGNDRKFCFDFHHYCDDKGSTLIIVKTKEGCIFGGVTSQSWKRTERPGGIFFIISSMYRQKS